MLTPTRRSILKRTLLLCIALGVMAVGVALSIKADLGTSPISSVPYVVSLMSEMSVGTATILINAILLVGEILIMRRQFQPIQLLQLAVVTLFGWLIDLCLWGLDGLTYADYGQQWMICIAGIIILGIGVSLEVTANLIPLPGEGLILSICTVLPIKFGNMKVIIYLPRRSLRCPGRNHRSCDLCRPCFKNGHQTDRTIPEMADQLKKIIFSRTLFRRTGTSPKILRAPQYTATDKSTLSPRTQCTAASRTLPSDLYPA